MYLLHSQRTHACSSVLFLTRVQILGVGLTITTELIGFFNGEDRVEEEFEKELPWASREVLAGAGFSEKSDVYSFGIVLWEIMQKDPSLPYAGLLPSQVCVAHVLRPAEAPMFPTLEVQFVTDARLYSSGARCHSCCARLRGKRLLILALPYTSMYSPKNAMKLGSLYQGAL